MHTQNTFNLLFTAVHRSKRQSLLVILMMDFYPIDSLGFL